MRKILAAVVALILGAVAFSMVFGSSLERDAKGALKERGLQPSEAREVAGVREKAVCGTASGKSFVYRNDSLVVDGDMPAQQYSAFYKAWCG